MDSEIGIVAEKRITEITETYEGSSMTLDVTLGDDGATTIRQLIRRGA